MYTSDSACFSRGLCTCVRILILYIHFIKVLNSSTKAYPQEMVTPVFILQSEMDRIISVIVVYKYALESHVCLSCFVRWEGVMAKYIKLMIDYNNMY